MGAVSILSGMNQEVTQVEMLGNLTAVMVAVLDKLARLDANDRAVVNIETGSVGLNAGQTLATVTTVTTVTTVGTLNSMGTTQRPTDAIPHHMSNIGVAHIYNQLVFG